MTGYGVKYSFVAGDILMYLAARSMNEDTLDSIGGLNRYWTGCNKHTGPALNDMGILRLNLFSYALQNLL